MVLCCIVMPGYCVKSGVMCKELAQCVTCRSGVVWAIPHMGYGVLVWGIAWWGTPSHWRNNSNDGVSNHQPHHCLLNRLFRRRSKKTSKLRVTGLCRGNSPVTGEFPAQMASNAENVSIWWRHHAGIVSYVVLVLCCVVLRCVVLLECVRPFN